MALRRLQSSHLLPTSSIRLHATPRAVSAGQRLLTTQPEPRPWKRKVFHSGIGFLPERSLATAFDYATVGERAPNAIDALPNQRYPLLYSSALSASEPRPLWELRPHNVTSPLIVEEAENMAARQRVNNRGIPGDVDEMRSVLDACLQVGKLDRAAVVLRRLNQPEFSIGINMTELQNQYLQVALEQLMADPDPVKADEMHKWYELEIRAKGGEQTPETIAYMIKASLLTAHGPRRERLIDRYMSMVPGDAGLEVLYMTGILNDQDRAAITDICRTYNLEPQDGVAPDGQSPLLAVDPTLFESALRSISPDMVTEPAVEGTTPETSLPDTPEVLSTPQKGVGLRVLKQTLNLFSEIPKGYDIASLGLRERREIQSRLERDCVEAAVERWREENEALTKIGRNSALGTASLNFRLHEWHKDMELRLSQELEKVELSEAVEKKTAQDVDRCMYGPFLRQSTTSRLAAVTIVSTLSCLSMHGADKGVSMVNAITQVAKVAEEDIQLQNYNKKMEAMGRRMSARANAKAAVLMALRRGMRPSKDLSALAEAADNNAAANAEAGGLAETVTDASAPAAGTTAAATGAPTITAPLTDEEPLAWPLAIRVKVGAALLSLLMETAKVTVVREHPETKTLISQEQAAFSRVGKFKRGRKVGTLVANEMLVDLMKREPRGDFLARHLPMVVQPEPWTKFDKGGFLEYPAPLVRAKDGRKEQQHYAVAAIKRGDMDQVLKGLDVLGRTAWKVNRPVFDVMLEAWNTGKEFAEIPPLEPDITIPPEPDSSEDPMKRRLWLKAVKIAENQRSSLHSLRCFMNFQMEIARALRDQTFYFPHNVDFRGRAYPIPPYFNHMGADHVRGLLMFGKGKKLGERGLQWIKVHLANVYGFDKASLLERAAFATENMDNIRDSAESPLEGRRWWLEAEDPWQCLAACFELTEAMKLEDPTEFVSHLPVHMDGTCNGLQHYAALGGDSWGARQVNLEPGDRPADVYSAVAEIVKEGIAEDVKKGDPNALALVGKIKRKVVKQTVMTNVYGVTFAGARKQVLKQLDALYPKLQEESGIAPVALASYISYKIFGALSTMFGGAHDIQHWLGEIGGRVCRALTADQVDMIVKGAPEEGHEAGWKKRGRPSKADKATKEAKKAIVKAAAAKAAAAAILPPVKRKRGRPSKAAKEAEAAAAAAAAKAAAAAAEAEAAGADLDDIVEAAEAEAETELAAPEISQTAYRKSSSKKTDDITGQFRSTLVWTTPLQMPVVQPYRKAASRTIETCLQDLILTVPGREDPVHKRKQLQAFPPNFIHSLDASHMLLSALECDARGLDFAAVHDSFWTHAADVDTMNGVLRDAFIRIHSEDVVGRLAAEFTARYRGSMYLAQLSRKSAVAKEIIAFRKTQRITLRDELVREKRRLDLLASNDPKEVARGRAMVTPASLLEQMGEEPEASIETEDLSEFRLGSIPAKVEGDGADGVDGFESAGEVDPTGFVEDLEVATTGRTTTQQETDAGDDQVGAFTFEAQLKKLPVTKPKKKASQPPVQIWLPLTFPPVPAKGDFDVRRLRDSAYFFS